MNTLRTAYLEGRGELLAACEKRLLAAGLPRSALEAVFWGEFYADDNHLPAAIGGGIPPRGRFTVPDFSVPVAPGIERWGTWKRLCVTTGWYLELSEFSGPEAWFESLSGKNRKKLRWLRNALPKLGARIVPLAGDEDFERFERLYSDQFPRHPLHSPGNLGVREIYRELERRGRAFARLLYDGDGNALAAALGYTNACALFYTHLTRARGEYDKYSPGYFLTYAIITEMMTRNPELKFFFMGPGEYDYKSALGGRAFPIFRYERDEWRNLFGLIRLRHRAAKELRRRK